MRAYTPDLRTCQFCKKQEFVFIDSAYRLFKYGVRHYAHATCLAWKHGTTGGGEMIPEHERSDYFRQLAEAQGLTS